MWNQRPSFRFEIDNFSKKEGAISSKIFVSGGSEWYLYVYPKRTGFADGHLSLYLYTANHKLLPTGWKRTADFYFLLLNQSDKELYRSSIARTWFCAETPGWGFLNLLPLSKFQEKGFLENDRFIIEVYINNSVEALSGYVIEKKKETVDINGFQVFASQVTLARKIFAEHPDFAQDFKPKNQVVKTEYMNVLLGLIITLNKSPLILSETELCNAHSELTELTEAGFKLEWLKLKLEKVSLEWNKADGSQVQQLEERVKSLEEVSLGRKIIDANESRVKQLEESFKILEMMVSDLKVELDKEKAKSSSDGFLLVNEVA